MKILSYILLFELALGSLFPAGDLSQMTKSGEVIDHYQLHVEAARQNGEEDFDFWDFVVIHFWETDDHQHPEDFHDRLPFHGFVQGMVLFRWVENPFWIPFFPDRGNAHHPLPLYSLDIHQPIFHPPIA